MKRCNTCKDLKALSLFYKNKVEPDGHRRECKKCTKIYNDNKGFGKRVPKNHRDNMSDYYLLSKIVKIIDESGEMVLSETAIAKIYKAIGQERKAK
jgi:hypothetical protein